MPRIRLPYAPRIYNGRTVRTWCVATTLAPEEVVALDNAAAAVRETRSEFIRRAVQLRIDGDE